MSGHDKSEHWVAHWISVCTHHLPAALVVASLVFIFHHHLHLLKAIDGYAFLGIGNLTAQEEIQYIGNKPLVGVVVIDQQTHEDFYRERSPLNRCELKKDLGAIYNLIPPPTLLVVDLDLSPALPLLLPDGTEDKTSTDCDTQLQTFLTQDHSPTRTVLMKPFAMLDKEAQVKARLWMDKVGKSMTFADPTIDVSFGLVNDLECKADSMAAIAFNKYQYPVPDPGPKNCLRSKSEKHPPALIISPGQYLSGLRGVSLCQLSSRQNDVRCKDYPPYEALYHFPVIFFGTSFGDSDTFLTPLGTMYGVEVHAAAFMSLLQPTTESSVLAFSLDVALGLLMGGLIDWSWRVYFSLRFSSSAFKRQAAPWLILMLTIGFVIVVGGLTLGSYWILRHCNIWLSPIPIALGMLIESFFNSAIGTAVKQGYEQRQALIRRLQACGPESYTTLLALEAEQHPHAAHSLQERAQRFFYLDYTRLWRLKKYGAAAFLFIRRLAFILVLALAYFWNEIF
jgi:hypothetical protein